MAPALASVGNHWMEHRPIVLVDLEGLLNRHWFGSEAVLRGPVPTLEPPVKRNERDLATRWRLDHWTWPERIIDPSVAAALSHSPTARSCS